jgi:hypothetical protein
LFARKSAGCVEGAQIVALSEGEWRVFKLIETDQWEIASVTILQAEISNSGPAIHGTHA